MDRAPETPGLKAIETSYGGYRFRSRLEARWAVFFDILGFNWEYEVEGFELPDNQWYLPDFRVMAPSGLVTWYEVKPRNTKSDAKHSAFEASLSTRHGQTTVLLAGDPVDWIVLEERRCCPRCGWLGVELESVRDRWGDDWTTASYCWPCDADPNWGEFDSRTISGAIIWFHKGDVLINDVDYQRWNRRVWIAAEKARGARFEHADRHRV